MHNTDTNAEKHLIVNLLVMSNVDCCSNTSQPWRPALCGWMRGGWVAPLPGYQAAVGILWHRTPIRYWYIQPCANCVRVSGRHRYQSQYRCTHTKRQANTPTHIHTHTHTHFGRTHTYSHLQYKHTSFGYTHSADGTEYCCFPVVFHMNSLHYFELSFYVRWCTQCR